MNRSNFYAALRGSALFSRGLSQPQVDGIEAILDACDDLRVTDARHIAYVLATPMIETGGTYEPVVENLNYSVEALTAKFGNRISRQDANRYGRKPGQAADQQAIANIIYGGEWGHGNLGNTQPGDGWKFRGRGECQATGRGNYQKFEELLGIPFTTNPELMGTLDAACKVMVIGMRDGLFTGKKLQNYFTPTSSDWKNARRIINGLDRADEIAGVAQKFHAAIKDAA